MDLFLMDLLAYRLRHQSRPRKRSGEVGRGRSSPRVTHSLARAALMSEYAAPSVRQPEIDHHDAERVDEAVGEDAGPEVSAGDEVGGAEDEPGHARIDDP